MPTLLGTAAQIPPEKEPHCFGRGTPSRASKGIPLPKYSQLAPLGKNRNGERHKFSLPWGTPLYKHGHGMEYRDLIRGCLQLFMQQTCMELLLCIEHCSRLYARTMSPGGERHFHCVPTMCQAQCQGTQASFDSCNQPMWFVSWRNFGFGCQVSIKMQKCWPVCHLNRVLCISEASHTSLGWCPQ